ncbi:type I-C CRISPR-associated protein Cas7/Csd2 [Tepidimonas sp.]|uniref:type I-C CRISPR-associated protein Cas7/Csd2 n=1 Tax=Tepidimonas sp. TaxID=2002775 RepID=UPI0028CDB5EB|nr:type I-C CRISPR-associated protein Cas7/Csd2 [Tepidimonas sp.]MDT7929562.1 type I-C CRISPR-associated protein Cas7/Csd2 [Tepidimonas sp.]
MSIQNRYDFVFLFDVKDGNPNGDPDAGNLPRVDAETGHGLVTDVALKRKVRNYVAMKHAGDQEATDGKGDLTANRFEIYVRERAVLNRQHQRAYAAYDLKPEAKKLPKDAQHARRVTGWMCKNFYDIRAFGAVMSTEVNSGQVRGPVQLTFARSIDPVVSAEHAITRMAVTNEADLEKERTMGRKFTIPYGLYRAHGFISAHLAGETGFDEQDLELLWEALKSMFEHDRSAARGEMATRGLFVFKHESALGNAPAHALFERIQIKRKDGVEVARDFMDYEVQVNETDMPPGVTLLRKV